VILGRVPARRAGLALVVLGAAALRFWAVGLGHEPVRFEVAPHHEVLVTPLSFQIDEDHNTWIPTRLTWHDLNPHAFYLPSLLWYLSFGVDQVLFWLGRQFGFFTTWADVRRLVEGPNPTPFFLVGRSLSAVLGTATVGLLYGVGCRLWSPAHGLLAAAFLAGTFLHVRDSALATTDAPTALFVVLSLLGTGGVLRQGRLRDYLLAGGGAGLAVATKYNAVLVLVALVVAHLSRRRETAVKPHHGATARRLAGATLVGALVFLTFDPYLLFDWREARVDLLWNANVFGHGRFVDVGPGWWYHLAVSLRYGMGVALLGLAAAGLAWGLWRHDPAAWTLGSFVAVFFAVMGAGRLVHVRYMTPLLPVLCLFAATALLGLSGWLPGPRTRWGLVAALGALVMVEPVDSAVRYGQVVHHVDTRVEAYEFLLTLPPESRIVTYGPSEVWRSVVPRWQPDYYAKQPEERWSDVLELLKTRETRYVLVHTSTLEVFSPTLPDLERALRGTATLLREFSPYLPGAHPQPVYDWTDPYYVPIGRFAGVKRPGPMIRLYHLD
jgi:4-amino-4-deoxy-L-arabinose transferase-like glycosyltransferase